MAVSAFGVDHGDISKADNDKGSGLGAATAGVGAGGVGTGAYFASKKPAANLQAKSDQNAKMLARKKNPPAMRADRMKFKTFYNNQRRLVNRPAMQAKALRRGGKAALALGAVGAATGIGVGAKKAFDNRG